LITFEFSVSLLLTVLCFVWPWQFGASAYWSKLGPLLLFFGLVPLLNAPFDWLSLGLTRGLLRRGLELRGPAPLLLALLDAALATVVIAMLAATMVLGVQAFDAFALRGGGQPVLPLPPLFKGLAEHPTAAEYWWLHALLLSTLVPSVVNLALGGFSLLRGWPTLNDWLLRQLPDRPSLTHAEVQQPYLVAFVLTAQWGVGALLGIAAQAVLVWAILGGAMPRVGVGLLELMRSLALLNLPGRLILGTAGG
jgi:hypothetical protein